MSQLLSSGQLKNAKPKHDLLSQLAGLPQAENDIADLEVGLVCHLLKRFLLVSYEM